MYAFCLVNKLEKMCFAQSPFQRKYYYFDKIATYL